MAELDHTKAGENHDFALKFPDATVLNFIVTDERGNPDITRIQETQIDRTALKTSTGTSKYSDFEFPYMSIVQDDWSGGRGAKNFEDDTTRFADSWMMRTDLSGKAFLGPRGNYTTGFRDMDQLVPAHDFHWRALYGDYEGYATQFTCAAATTYAADRAEVWLRKVGTPGTLTLKLMSDTGADLPNAVLKSATLAASAVTDVLSFIHSFDWTTTQTLTGGTKYWIALVAASTDDATNHWEVGYGVATGAKTADGTTWAADTNGLFFRVLDAEYDFRPIYFEYKRGLYMVKTDREDGNNAILYINGDRGAADSNSGALDTLVDATKSWTADEFFGATVILIEGPGSEEAQPWRRIVANDATSLTVSPNWKVTHTTATSYVIVEAEKWRLVDAGGLSGDLETQVTDVAVAGDFVYFARGVTNSKKVLRYEAYNKAGVWTERNEAEDFSALYLQAIRHPDEGMVLYGACNSKTDGTDDFGCRRVWKGNVPRVWGKLYRSLGTVDATNVPWDSRDIANVVQSTNGAFSISSIAAGFTTGIASVRNLTTPTDLRSGKTLVFYIVSSVATDTVGDLELVLSDQINLGASTPVSYVYHWESGTGYVERPLAHDGRTDTVETIVTFAADEYLYICAPNMFDTITFALGTLNTVNTAMTVEYFNGQTWAAVSTLSDGTIAAGTDRLGQDGSMTFVVSWNWTQNTIDGKTGYWIRMRPTSATLTANITIEEIKVSRATTVNLDIPILEAGVLTFVKLAITPTAISTIDYSAIQSIGLNVVTENGAQTVYIGYGVELLSHYLDYVIIPSDQKITGMRAYAGNQTDPYNNPWVFTESAIYEIQTQNSDALVELPIGEIKELASENTGLAKTVNDVYLYFSLGVEKLERYYGRNLDDIGPDMDEGLPSNRRGKPRAMLSYPGRVFLAIDAGNNGYSSILAYKGSGWHEIWRAERAGQHCLSLYHQVIPGSVMGRLWTNAGAEAVWIPFTLNDDIPGGDTQIHMHYFHEGTLETPWIYGNMVDVIKQWNSLKVFFESDDADAYIEADYKTESVTTWPEISGAFDTEPSEELFFSVADPPNLSARKIKLRFRFYGDGKYTPVMTAMLIEAYGVAPVKYRWSFPCILSEMIDQRRNLAEEEELILNNYTAVETAIAKLRTAVDNGYALTMTSRFSPYTSKTVMLSSAIGRPIEISQNDQEPVEKHLFNIVLDQR